MEFDVFFGPAYKGIPLAASIAIAWFDLFGESKDFSYNRKEVKDHGEVIQVIRFRHLCSTCDLHSLCNPDANRNDDKWIVIIVNDVGRAGL